MIVTQIDTACCLIDIGDVKILTDPVWDNAGELYHHRYGAFSRKIENPK
jgi:L-ascorbate metabolism protein UlaG (beta-lactamase superfamily)